MRTDANNLFHIKISEEAIEYINLNGGSAIIRYGKKG